MSSRRFDIAVVAGLCAVGVALRVTGLTGQDLWFDDAWAALPAHVSLGDALHMVVTTPLYTLSLRQWIILGPHDTWFAQLPALVLGVAGIAAVYALIVSLGFSRLAAFAAGAAVMAGPVTIEYSTRLKEYPSDLLCACLVLWLADRWRRDPSTQRLVQLGVVAVACLWISASTAAVVGGAAAMVVAVAWGRRELRAPAAALVGALALGSAGLWAVFLRHVPSQLRANWRTHGFLFGYSSGHHLAYTFQQTFSGLSHGLVGLPIPWTSSASALRALPMALAIATVIVLVAIVEPPIAEAVRARGRRVGATFAAAASVTLAVLGTLSGLSPLGDGRTDEVLYPSLLVLVVSVATWLTTRATASSRMRGAARVATACVVVAGALLFGAAHVGEYPPTGLSEVLAGVSRQLLFKDVVVIDGYEAFTYADDSAAGLWRVSFAPTEVPWPMGFHVVSLDATYAISTNYLQSDPQIEGLFKRTHRVWYVGPTIGGYSTAAPTSIWPAAYPSPTCIALSDLGFVGTDHFVTAPGVYAQLLVYHPARISPGGPQPVNLTCG